MKKEALNVTQSPCCSFCAIYINPIKMTQSLIQMLHTNWTKGWGDIQAHMECLISWECSNYRFFFCRSWKCRLWLCLKQSACWNVSFWLADLHSPVVVFILGNICSLTGLITWAVAVFSQLDDELVPLGFALLEWMHMPRQSMLGTAVKYQCKNLLFYFWIAWICLVAIWDVV